MTTGWRTGGTPQIPDRRVRPSGSPAAVLNRTLPLPTDLEGGVDLLPNVRVLVSSLLARLRLLVERDLRATNKRSARAMRSTCSLTSGPIGLPENSEGQMNPHDCDL
jgi:hypothetical protein